MKLMVPGIFFSAVLCIRCVFFPAFWRIIFIIKIIKRNEHVNTKQMFFQQLPSIISVGSLQNYNDADMFGRYCGLPALMCTWFFFLYSSHSFHVIFFVWPVNLSHLCLGVLVRRKHCACVKARSGSGLVCTLLQWHVITANGNKTDKNNKRTDMAFSQSHDHGPEPLHLWFYTAFQIIMQMFFVFFPKQLM